VRAQAARRVHTRAQALSPPEALPILPARQVSCSTTLLVLIDYCRYHSHDFCLVIIIAIRRQAQVCCPRCCTAQETGCPCQGGCCCIFLSFLLSFFPSKVPILCFVEISGHLCIVFLGECLISLHILENVVFCVLFKDANVEYNPAFFLCF
jgi:hypothetical protein